NLMVLSVVIAFIGIYIAYLFYIKKPDLPKQFVKKFSGLYNTVHNKYFVDEIYFTLFVRSLLGIGRFLLRVVDERIIDGLVNGTGRLMRGIGSIIRRIETGYVQGYAFGIILGAIIVVGYLILKPIM
ncbi:MAG: hypothetical protein Q7J12_05250, partial [Syntrophales bacterium]|nr:hypothetical protein [Syntrophales bacterium]